MNKQEILEEFDNTFEEDIIGFKNGSIMEPIHLSEWLSSALDRYAMSVIEASVPPRDVAYKPAGNGDNLDGWNTCRNTTLNKAKEITKQV